MQLRLHASKTIARPQFRELAPQIYQDFESDREFTGNPFLTTAELWNAEARYEYYFAPRPKGHVAGFYKRIDNPIEAAAFFAGGGQLRTGFANAPRAELYGAEVEVQAYLPLRASAGRFFATRRLLFIGNYTYTQSQVTADASAIIGPDLQPVAADLLFEDGAPLTGQSDHLANLQLGIEDSDSLARRPSRSAMRATGSPIAARSRAWRASPTSSSVRASGSISCCARTCPCSAPAPN